MRKNICEDAVLVRMVEPRQKAYLSRLEANSEMTKESLDGTTWDWATRSLNLPILVLVNAPHLWQAVSKTVPSGPHLLVSIPSWNSLFLSIYWSKGLAAQTREYGRGDEMSHLWLGYIRLWLPTPGILFLLGFDETSCHVGKTHMARNWDQSTAN